MFLQLVDLHIPGIENGSTSKQLFDENMGYITPKGNSCVRIKLGYPRFRNPQQFHVSVGDQGDGAMCSRLHQSQKAGYSSDMEINVSEGFAKTRTLNDEIARQDLPATVGGIAALV